MISSTKPEAHSILHCCQRRTEPRPRVACTENFVKLRHVVFEICKRTDRQTNKHTYRQTYSHADHNTTHLLSSVLFFSLPYSEGWPHHGRTFSIYLCPLAFWLTLPQGFLYMYWCCLSTPCVVFLACVHLALFLALSHSPGNSLVLSWCDHSMLASLLWQCLTVPFLLQLC